ncbi:hypothetical protein [Microbacterium sp. ZW T5_56]
MCTGRSRGKKSTSYGNSSALSITAGFRDQVVATFETTTDDRAGG